MAQSAVRSALHAGGEGLHGITEDQMYELEQYQKIVRLRDAVLSGTHPTIKVPPELLAQADATRKTSTGKAASLGDPLHGATSPERAAEGSTHDLSAPGPVLAHADSVAKRPVPEINPIFLEKSEHLIKAELKLQRQRAERALREEVEQRRPAKQLPSELSTDIDIPDVLSKALAIVPAVPPAITAVPDAAANSDNRSDSFDNNTFYSSQHDTPEFRSNPSPKDAAKEVGISNAVPDDSDEATEDIYDPQTPVGPGTTGPASPPKAATDHGPLASLPRPVASVPGLNNYPAQSSDTMQAAPRQGNDHKFLPGLSAIQPFHVVPSGPSNSSLRPLAAEAYAEAHPPSPLLQTHEPQPIAPQTAHYATLHMDSSASNSGAPTATGTPAQVAALRTEPMSATSPDSSPQGGRVLERKRSKKKKRKAERQAAGSEHVAVKPEPRSPSPMAAPSYIRPNKRPRHSHRQMQGQNSTFPPAQAPGLGPGYDTPDFETATASGRPSHAPPTLSAQGEPVPLTQARGGHYPPRSVSSAIHSSRRHSGGYVDPRGRIAHPAGYGAYPLQPYHGQEHQDVMYDYADSSEGYPRAVPHHIPYEGASFAGVPRPQPQRIYVDLTGREFIEPRRPVVRQSGTPAGYYMEPEMVYERAPPRAVSRFAEPPHYVEAGPPYGPPTQSYAPSRRVVTQPEYVQQPFGETYPSEYPRRSMMPPDLRSTEVSAQEFGGRAGSVRPPPPPAAPAPGAYASPHDYGGGPEGRIETVVRGYGQGASVMSRQTPAQGYAWEYEAGPSAHQVSHTAPGPGYYAGSTRGADEIAFIEQPRGATHEIVYTDSAREEVYR